MAIISIRFDEEDNLLIREYAKLKNMNVSDLIRETLIEKIEDELDLTAFNKALEAYRKDPKTYTLDEVEKELTK